MPPFDLADWTKQPQLVLQPGYSVCPDCNRLMKTEHLPDPDEYCPAKIRAREAAAAAETAAAPATEAQ